MLLHQPFEHSALINLCHVLYDRHRILDAVHIEQMDHPVAQKLAHFIRGLREDALAWNSGEVYALLVLDAALMHLGALSFVSPGNNVIDPVAAGCVAAFAADWYEQIRLETEPQSTASGSR